MTEHTSLTGKTAVITGGVSGIGRAIVERFAASGARVVVFDVDAPGAEALSAALPGVVTGLVDVSDFAAMEAAFGLLERVDILVNNSGIGHIGTVETTTAEDMDRLYRVNVKGVFHGLKLAIPRMMQQGGGVVLNMCSIAAKVGLEARFAYSMTKGAVLAMTLQTARDYVSRGIRCNCLCPARVHTPFVDQYLAKNYPGREEEMFRVLSAAQPLGRMGEPREIADLALYLCSDAASFVTGVAWDIDGGVTGLR
ncbi:MAG TPA: SDR family oxidoreductase [Verrucomicrobiales bacterium]|jgi:NAD(P)-dependent dehydrogenase (short-subunit alcohol dehydrogenase family)|nr:SDR family oxidoreductase [Verrucomicrobiales bacterium]